MRVALDGKPLAATLTGVGHYSLELASALASVAPADDFTLLSPTPLESAAAIEVKRRLSRNFHEIHLNSHRLNRYWWSLGLPLYLSKSSFDLFHGTNYDIPRLGRTLALVTIHDLSLLLHPDTHDQRLVARARRRLPKVARHATMIITGSESVKREICSLLNVATSKVAVTPYEPLSVFKRMAREITIEIRKRLGIADDFILFVGTIEPRKNLQTLAKAFAEILHSTPHRPQLVIAGKTGWLMSDFCSYLKLAGVEEKVCFTGYLDDEDLRALYSSCSLFVYPSIYEGFGLPPLEAMACGAPVITSDISAIRETVGTAARLVSPLDVDGLARVMAQLLADNREREMMGNLGLEHALKFTWDRTASLTLEVYKEVLARAQAL
jgi:glycosyltransferase involved in cell wall biosynthesis